MREDLKKLSEVKFPSPVTKTTIGQIFQRACVLNNNLTRFAFFCEGGFRGDRKGIEPTQETLRGSLYSGMGDLNFHCVADPRTSSQYSSIRFDGVDADFSEIYRTVQRASDYVFRKS
jgi:hypothetical protein